jgi:hypothetical protein
MTSTSLTQTILLGDLVVALFDQATGFAPTDAADVTAKVVTDMLLRAGNTRAIRELRLLALTSR